MENVVAITAINTDRCVLFADWSEVLHRGFTRAQLDSAFSALHGLKHWKDAIDAEVRTEDLGLALAALEFYTGCSINSGSIRVLAVEGSDDTLFIRCKGYYAVCGA